MTLFNLLHGLSIIDKHYEKNMQFDNGLMIDLDTDFNINGNVIICIHFDKGFKSISKSNYLELEDLDWYFKKDIDGGDNWYLELT